MVRRFQTGKMFFFGNLHPHNSSFDRNRGKAQWDSAFYSELEGSWFKIQLKKVVIITKICEWKVSEWNLPYLEVNEI